MIVQFFIPMAELVISTGKQTNEADVEIETQPVTVESNMQVLNIIYILTCLLIFFTH